MLNKVSNKYEQCILILNQFKAEQVGVIVHGQHRIFLNIPSQMERQLPAHE